MIFLSSQISEGQEEEKDNSTMIDYQHYIISSQSEYQKKCLSALDVADEKTTVFVEGPISLWMNHVREEYFILKSARRALVTTENLHVQPDEEREGKFVSCLSICLSAIFV